MLFLADLQVENYKNLESIDLHFEHKFNCFTGRNGAGKTNLLDTIHYLSLGKSYFSSNEIQNIHFDSSYFSLRSRFVRNNETFQINCGYIKNDRKVIKKNGEPYSRFSEHVGEFPVVIVTPYDIDLIRDGGEIRRKFTDILISQTDKHYLEKLVEYVRVLKQRNAQLKIMSSSGSRDRRLLEIYNGQLCHSAKYLHQARKDFIGSFSVLFRDFYHEISDSNEQPGIEYLSRMNTCSLEELLEQNFEEDLRTERTNAGPHRDDLDLLIDDRSIKKFGSQGQQKSFLISLKLAEFISIKNKKGYPPLLLLDDIFEKLDMTRIEKLMKIISGKDFNQVFITDTDENRILNFLRDYARDLKVYHVEKGSIR